MIQRLQIGTLLLAAGAARRMGRLKQLLLLDGKPLVRQALDAAVAAQLGPVVVVLGAHADEVRAALADAPALIVENPDWREGLGASLRCGIAALDQPDIAAAIVQLTDQPRVRATDLRALADRFAAGGYGIVAAQYAGTLGPPALFGRPYFPALRALHGDQGARRIIEAHRDDVLAYDCPAAAFDIDTPEDYQQAQAGGAPA